MRYRWAVMCYWFIRLPERLAWWVAFHLPPQVALFAFVRVSSCPPWSPGYDYPLLYEYWRDKHGLKR